MTGPPALRVNIIKNIGSLSIVLQWDAVDDSFPTTYTVVWTDGRLLGTATTEEQTSYTITGLTLDTIYAITVAAANTCGSGPEFQTSVSLSTDTTSTTSTISPTVTASIISMIITSTVDPVNIIRSATTTATINTATSAITTTNSMSAAVSRDGSTTKSTTSRIALNSHLGSTIAMCTTTTLINCFGTYCYYHYCCH